MLKELKRLPFEERNEQDFEDLTHKIWDALTIIKKTKSIPTTQGKLAELVGCTRKTLHNRGWPISELKKIKEERKDSKPKNTTAEHRLTSEKHITREKLLIGQIRNLQEQNGSLFDQVQELEEQKATLTDTVKVLEDEVVILKDEKRTLEKELRNLKEGRHSRTNVVSIKTMKKTKRAKKEGK